MVLEKRRDPVRSAGVRRFAVHVAMPSQVDGHHQRRVRAPTRARSKLGSPLEHEFRALKEQLDRGVRDKLADLTPNERHTTNSKPGRWGQLVSPR